MKTDHLQCENMIHVERLWSDPATGRRFMQILLKLVTPATNLTSVALWQTADIRGTRVATRSIRFRLTTTCRTQTQAPPTLQWNLNIDKKKLNWAGPF